MFTINIYIHGVIRSHHPKDYMAVGKIQPTVQPDFHYFPSTPKNPTQCGTISLLIDTICTFYVSNDAFVQSGTSPDHKASFSYMLVLCMHLHGYCHVPVSHLNLISSYIPSKIKIINSYHTLSKHSQMYVSKQSFP